MNCKEFLSYLNEKGISFDKTRSELRELSKKEGLINYTMVFLPNEKIIKVKQNVDFNQISELVILKKNLLNIESQSLYSGRTFTTVSKSLLDDSQISKYEKERIKNVKIKCWRLYVKATGIEIEKNKCLSHCEELGIEVPIKAYDRTIFAFMVKKYDIDEKF
ncbi:unnamed protein product [Brachionus calyciflorus]|uniref:Uncharacterized protein n=1 Tax=Brachionus calyciflorus TaxID=104777 RepID=A0A813X313_9BILA|nr:unnamed protein product [Brachionus calyciflorus]